MSIGSAIVKRHEPSVKLGMALNKSSNYYYYQLCFKESEFQFFIINIKWSTSFLVVFIVFQTSLQARSADLPASPAGLFGHFAPSGFARILHLALTKIFEKKKYVSID